ncbi:MAG: preprotein translocase subunit SecG [Devosia sp.]|nr:preprotein translocase subunit SecG [Devosia sp.]
MANVLIVAYLLIVLALIAVILLQRSEGGGLGMGGNAGGLMTVRGSANLLTRTTAVLAALFFATAIGLTILTEIDRPAQSILERAADGVGAGTAAPTSVLDALNALQGEAAPAAPAPATDPALAVPATETPAAPADAPATDASTGTEAQPGTTTPAAPAN